jgi:hypothetical protein
MKRPVRFGVWAMDQDRGCAAGPAWPAPGWREAKGKPVLEPGNMWVA